MGLLPEAGVAEASLSLFSGALYSPRSKIVDNKAFRAGLPAPARQIIFTHGEHGLPEDPNKAVPAEGSRATPPDTRQRQLQHWLQQQAGISEPGEAASSDASFRRYFRYRHNGRTLIAMDAPPETEDCRPFIKVAGMLAAAGVVVPEILAADPDQGFMLLSDLGNRTCLELMIAPDFDPDCAEGIFGRAIDAMIRFQQIGDIDDLPRYDIALLQREMELFPEWYLRRHLNVELTADLRGLLDSLFAQLIEAVTRQAYVFVHRDFMPRNLMAMTDTVGVLDFQDAVCGPISYDPICLFKDAFISWPEARVEHWLSQYWGQARSAGLPVADSFEAFLRDCDYMGVQRHLKVIGIFARICYRDGKPHYLSDVPRFFGYLRTVAARRPELTALRLLLERLESVK